MTNFIIGQVISTIGLILSVAITQFKEVKHILLGDITANLIVALSYVFLGGMSGAWICIVGAVQVFIIYQGNKRNISQETRNKLTLVFAAAYIIGTIVVYQGWSDIVSCACAMLYVLAIIQTASSGYRIFMLLNSSLWVIYDISTAAYVNMLTHGMMVVSLIIAMLRLDRKKHN